MSTNPAAPTVPDAARMLRALDEAAVRIETLERARREPIAVIGLACRLPGRVRDAAEFWQLLRAGVDATGEVPADRWDADALYDPNPDVPGRICTRRGAFLDEVDRFDAAHFSVSPREAAAMDPQQRLLLEVAHEALDSAGQLGDRLAPNATGVFVGITNNDYAQLMKTAAGERPLDAYFVTGNAPNAAAGRISYLLGLRGPAMSVDSACSSSLVTIHLACQSLRSGECSLALAGGVNLILAPDASAALSRARMLAPDGRCKTFDAAADGYARGEGCGLVVLKRLSDAERAGDRILAVVRGSAVNQDGPSSGFTVPSGAAQRQLLRAALTAARLSPGDIDYVEAHGTGTALGDPIEVGALGEVLGENRPPERPLLLGSVKTNIGHLESAAGIAGFLKTVLALWHRELPAHLHFRHPSPRIPWADLPVRVVRTTQTWPDPGRSRRAGVSSFGVSGTNAHIVLEEAPAAVRAAELPLPRKRFRGERHWALPPVTVAWPKDWLYTIDWPEQPRRERAESVLAGQDVTAPAAQVRRWLAATPPIGAGGAYAGCLRELEQVAAGFARRAVAQLAGAAIPSAQQRLFARLQELARSADAAPDPAAALARLGQTVPAARAEITMLARCGTQLVEVLQGRLDPLTLLFPAGEAVTAATLYGETPTAQAANALVQAVASAAIGARPGLRILEIGAGTGGTTAALLPVLPEAGTEYVFTDVSPVFVAQARERYRDRAWLRPQLLDIERDPLAQGFAAGEFDVVIAANVLHATRDLTTTLRHARRLLARGGVLVVLEATAPLGFLDLIFGLTDGWWRFEDTALRGSHALLPPGRWRECLQGAGFGRVEAFGYSDAVGEIFAQQSVFLAAATDPVPASPPAAGAWLVVAPEALPAVDALVRSLAAAGSRCERVGPDGDFAGTLATRPDWQGVIHAVALAATDPVDPAPMQSALRLAQTLANRPTPLFFLTAGAVAATECDVVNGVGGAPLWGFARALGQEHPELRPTCLDWDGTTSAERIVPDLLRPDGETQIAWRSETRHVGRLANWQLSAPVTQQAAPKVTAEATYLIVGGLGGLGLPLARWLVERGARHLVLASRSAAGSAPATAGLTALGAEVRCVAMDVTRASDVARVLAEIAATPWPLRGVVHAAGVLDDGVVRQLTWERFARVLGPKVAGVWWLDRLTREVPLDWMVLFSSATAVLGAPGQSNHAAANAFLDALAHRRERGGQRTLSIDWGPWSEIGAAARREVGAHVKAKGFGTIAPAQGWRIFDALFATARPQVTVLPADWHEVPAELTATPFFARVRRAAAAATSTEPGPAQAWERLPLPARTQQLLDLARAEVARVLGLTGPSDVDPAKGFFALGMDSLTSVELRNRLQARVGRPLPATLAFDHPTAEKVARFVARLWELEPGGLAAAVQPSTGPEAAAGAGATGAAAPLAVVGYALRFPGAVNPEELWTLLRDGVDAIAEVPRDRWDVDAFYDPDPATPGKMNTRSGGFIAGADQFDAGLFGVSPREAEHMDPQHRLLLETTWEALERAGIAPDSLAGSRTGVFVGIGSQDYLQMLAARGVEHVDPYVGSGNAHSVAAGRLSYTLGLQGPSMPVDTACSSSLVAVHLAAQSLRTGDCDLALVGGVNLILSPLISVNHSRARMLAPDGRCKAFDASADGFSRAEGCGMVVLKRLDVAQREGDRILAVVRGTAVDHDGRTSGLTVPSGPAQQTVIRAALRQAGIAPAEVGYVEAHGTGTSLGDPIELGALQAVYGEGRPKEAPLVVGSIKTNVGHLETAAGIAGLIKTVLVLQRGEIPPHLHFRNPNPLVPWSEIAIEVPATLRRWTVRPGGTRIAGVSSFGFGGTNAHVVLSEPPPVAPPETAAGASLPLVLSARTEPALRALAGRMADFLATSAAPWNAVCLTAATGRAAFRHRLAVLGGDGHAAAAELRRYLAAGSAAAGASAAGGEPKKVAFLFSGQGSMYAGAGRELAQACGVFRAALEECRTIVQGHAGWDVVAALGSEEKMARTEFAQVGLFALQYALARTWQAWGVQPAIVLGHSVGEYAAACIAGVLTTEAALRLLIERARLMGALSDDGAMLAVVATRAEVADIVARHRVEVGAVNGPRQVVLTGERGAMVAAQAELKARGVAAQLLTVRQAYHSRHMEPMIAAFEQAAATTTFCAEPTATFISGVSGGVAGKEIAGAGYWTDQIRHPVLFGTAAQAAEREGAGIMIEVGPRGLLIALAQQSWTDPDTDWLTSMRPGKSELEQMRTSAVQAWAGGCPVAWREVCRGERFERVELPTYPFQHRRYWFESGADAAGPRAVAPAPAYVVEWEATPSAARAAGATGSWAVAGEGGELRSALAARGVALAGGPQEATQGIVFVARGGADDGPELQRLLKGAAPAAAVCVVTRRVVAVCPDEAGSVNPDAAIAWCVAKVAALEYPAQRITRVDADVPMETLVAELLANAPEDDVALRPSGRYAARLRPHQPGSALFRPRADRSYLITGGLGALGVRVADWLVSRGARHLSLLGRHGPSPVVAATIERWRAAGVTVAVHPVDVADRRALASVLDLVNPALDGVFHAAGVAGEQPLAQLSAEAWAGVLRAKIEGARWLDELTAGSPLGAFVLFSSIASVWGSKGQAHYAAANGWLDALAAKRRAGGRAALSVSWGPWAGGGMATGDAVARLESTGVRLLPPSAALAALEHLIPGGEPHGVVAAVDWPRFREVYELRGPRSLLARMPGAEGARSSPLPAPEATVMAALRGAAAGDRFARLCEHVQGTLAQILKLPRGERPDPRQGFTDLGVDSLMALELRNRLGRELGLSLPATLAFDYPDVERLTHHLLGRLAPDAASPAPAPAPDRRAAVAEVATASEEEIERRLLEKLDQL
jgi:acyl transferase domain-containing protein/SAM-dependent methyltransferase/short-subunit dehydrogenase/acyl carrier protein